jgi:hypothetical protein
MIFGFDDPDFNKRRNRLIDLARSAPKGVELEQIVPGGIYTVSTCKATGDRSYQDTIWEVKAVAGASILAIARNDGFWRDRGSVLLNFSEREWYPAEHLLLEWESADQERRYSASQRATERAAPQIATLSDEIDRLAAENTDLRRQLAEKAPTSKSA